MSSLMKFFDKITLHLVVLCGASLLISWLSYPLGFWKYADVFAIASVSFGAVHAIRSAAESIKQKQVDVNLLMVLAGAGAIAIGEYADAGILLFLFSLSSYLEEAAMARTESEISALMKLRPDKAILILDGKDEEITIEEIVPEQMLRVLPFERFPVDGVLISDSGSVSEGIMTGESVPIYKSKGDKLISGAQNLDTMMVMKATSEAKDSALQRIVEMVTEAQTQKATSARITEWFGTRYAIIVIVVFIISLIVRNLTGQGATVAFAQSLILLVALSPCAVVIASPAASLSALARAAKMGILIRNGGFLEEAGLIDTVTMDKTGTITKGIPEVTQILIFDAGSGQETGNWEIGGSFEKEWETLFSNIAATEAASTHPIAEAIVKFTQAKHIEFPQADLANVIPGLGIESKIGEFEVKIGQKKYFESLNLVLPDGLSEALETMKAAGQTIALAHHVAPASATWVLIALQDEARKKAKQTIERLRSMGIEVKMLTGDHDAIAQNMAKEVGIHEVHANLAPEDKHKLIQDLVTSGKKVMMVGDGVNDAPSLSSSNLGVAMGGLGSEVAMESADVILVNDKIERIADLIELGRKTRRTIKASLTFAVGVIIVLTIGSLFGVVPLPIAVIGHEGSTFIAMMNGLRLLKFSSQYK